MKKIYLTEEQIDTLRNAYEQTLGTSDYLKYACAWYFKSPKTGKWIFSVYGCPCSFNKCYLKTVHGTLFIYDDNEDNRIELNDECKKLLNIA